MDRPSTEEVHAAIAAYLSDSRNCNQTFTDIAKKLNVSLSTLRRVAAEFGIVRRPRLGKTVMETIERARREESQ